MQKAKKNKGWCVVRNRVIAVRQETYTQLLELRGKMMAEKKRNVTFDEIIQKLLEKAEGEEEWGL